MEKKTKQKWNVIIKHWFEKNYAWCLVFWSLSSSSSSSFCCSFAVNACYCLLNLSRVYNARIKNQHFYTHADPNRNALNSTLLFIFQSIYSSSSSSFSIFISFSEYLSVFILDHFKLKIWIASHSRYNSAWIVSCELCQLFEKEVIKRRINTSARVRFALYWKICE